MILDLGLGGVRVAAEVLSLTGRVWLCLEEPVVTDYIVGEVVRCQGDGLHAIRFFEECPLDFFHAATLGIDLYMRY
jgi:hypothetical protein